MSAEIDDTIKDIAVAHGISLSKDDPLLIFQTMNSRLMEQHRSAQEKLLNAFKEEIEETSSRWQSDSKEKAEKILNVALNASKSAMSSMIKNSSDDLLNKVRAENQIHISKIRQLNIDAQKQSKFTLFSCGAIFIVSLMLSLYLKI